ncbi:DUF4190 domain-containing protein [Streptomyces sp. JJ36]|uniref:DUF4190 domain-containing protein n=1 Tax=Streptomyces sp. JJ36 TaxID=2736645 RepID=UPI001F197ED6|nr:DUF4190 domain-containing protein [Streptomyces sp. JJ36]MCF6523078.1 DUF4190 domain-containing protein [Streptomyces sp. JJ36]
MSTTVSAPGTGRASGGTGTPGPAREPAAARRNTDGMAVASFVLGLTGLLVFNIVLGPLAVVLAGLALHRGTRRRGRALAGLGLGVADLVVLATLVTANGTVSWNLSG